MARARLRICEKKRGNRRTGSKVAGRVGEAVFFSVLLLVGCGGLAVLMAVQALPQWRARHEFVGHRCRVLDTRLGENDTGDGMLYRPEVQIEYEVDGEVYRTWTYDVWHYHPRGGYAADREAAEKSLARFAGAESALDRTHVCWYDPLDPSVVVLVRGTSWWVWLTFLVPIAFVLIGGGGLIYTVSTWGKSAERRAAAGYKAVNGTANNGNGRKKKLEYPNVPSGTNVTDSPGTKLAYRLPVASRSTWSMLVTLTVCLFWNGIVAVFVTIAVVGIVRGEPDWLLIGFVTPFLAVGAGFAALLIRQFVHATGVGPTLVEISDQPLRPGRRYDLFVSQTGRLKIKSLEMQLVCEEETTYRHGTNARTETRPVYRQPVFEQRGFEIRRGLPFEADCELVVPAGAMHSFKSDHSEIKWKLIVKGSAEGWPDYTRSFPVIVYPGGNGKQGK